MARLVMLAHCAIDAVLGSCERGADRFDGSIAPCMRIALASGRQKEWLECAMLGFGPEAVPADWFHVGMAHGYSGCCSSSFMPMANALSAMAAPRRSALCSHAMRRASAALPWMQ